MRLPLLALAAITTAVPAAAATRVLTDLNDGWRFQQSDLEGGQAADLDDSAWSSVRLPHDWSIRGDFQKDAPSGSSGGFLPTGVAWYRKHFTTPEAGGGRRVFVEFDGVMSNSDVWINGAHLGSRPSGYVGLRYELTPHLKAGGENVLAVRADTSAQPASRWYTGSGIYRKARLVVVDPVRFSQDGVFLSTPEVAAESAVLACQAEVMNESDADLEVTLRTTVHSPDGAEVATREAVGQVLAGAVGVVEQDLSITKPELWHVSHGALYTVTNQLLVDGQPRDEVATRIGIRRAEFRPDTGFWLNGQNLKLKGVCLHHCAGAVGAAVPKSLWRERLMALQRLGVNAVRTSHNPVDPVFLDLCDELGLLVMDEFFDVWHRGKRRHDYHLYFDEWWRRDLRETVRRDRNHPSVIMYSVGNEIRDTHDAEHAKRVLAGLVEVCHQTDPTRPVTQGLFRPNVTHDYDNGLADLLDVIGTNYRTTELLDAWRDDPTRKVVNTEQGHDRSRWLTCRDNAQVAGQFLWVGIDYLGESARWPITTFDTGLLDRTGHPHARGYERQSWWSETPMVRAFRRVAPTALTPEDPGYEESEWKRPQVLFDDWTPQDADPGEQLVEVYSNCEEVELLLNGESLGAQPLSRSGRARQWRVDYQPGKLVAVARDSGAEVARHELQTAGPPARLELISSVGQLSDSVDQVAVVEARVVDASGVLVPGAEQLVTFTVDGPGAVRAVDNGSPTSHEPFRGDQRTTYRGRCIAIVGADAAEGELTVTAAAEGLEPGEATIRVAE
ncbi:Beta-galactosidase [Posidoniimonas corsicana]|uniref:Beta-galactosidase n=1 Tax=Posidoniimonas corsicana TaxID=1938618 RepID=A0A5C5VI96_9BACT|nr:glycoside hydrolase family 2 TIM barrel-domain containing protein [Posidoniimonas corsicana]TWT37630.1 Beta-galactosidase [Posidoniimonas corsicana]